MVNAPQAVQIIMSPLDSITYTHNIQFSAMPVIFSVVVNA